MKKFKEFAWSLLSRKFILALIGAVVAFGNSYYDWGMTTQEVWATITPLLGFIGMEGFADAKRAENE